MSRASGIGSWPGEDVRTPVRRIRDILTATPSGGEPGIPYLPELPARGPGAEMLGRTAAMLADMPIDLQPSGWRLVDHPGRDQQRAAAFLRQDLDELAEAYDGYSGDLKLQLTGPWTLASGLRLLRGERVLADAGACRDLVDSLAEGLRTHVGAVQRLVPGARLVVQIDEPSLPAVLAGELSTSSGFGRLQRVDPEIARNGLARVLDAADGRHTVVHCCAPLSPLPLLRSAGVRAVSLDVSLLKPSTWESVAVTVESGIDLWAGVVRSDVPLGERTTYREVVDSLVRSWRDVGLEMRLLDRVVLTPACGLSGRTPDEARCTQQILVDAAASLTETAGE